MIKDVHVMLKIKQESVEVDFFVVFFFKYFEFEVYWLFLIKITQFLNVKICSIGNDMVH